MPLVHRRCLGCGKIIALEKYNITPNNVDPSDPVIGRYRGMYCGDCAQSHRWDRRFITICKNCEMFFKTTDPSEEYCCEECKAGKRFTKNKKGNYNRRYIWENYTLDLVEHLKVIEKKKK